MSFFVYWKERKKTKNSLGKILIYSYFFFLFWYVWGKKEKMKEKMKDKQKKDAIVNKMLRKGGRKDGREGGVGWGGRERAAGEGRGE